MKFEPAFLVAGATWLALMGVPPETRSKERPNILFVITDDESRQERSAYGWSALPTPHFDRVAREGVLFSNAFASAPSCTPSRAAVLTGRNFWELKNTLVILTSDNGTAIAQGKATPYEWGVHEPLAIMWQNTIPPGREVTDFVNFADFAPTFREAAGLEAPDSMSGRSLLPILTSRQSGRIDPTRNFTVTGLEWHGEFDPESLSSRTVRDDRYAYIVRYSNVDDGGNTLDNQRSIRPASVEFYDLKDDPWQQSNLAENAGHADAIRRLSEMLRRVQWETGDPRATGEMNLFRRTRQFVQARKKAGYPDTESSMGFWPADESQRP